MGKKSNDIKGNLGTRGVLGGKTVGYDSDDSRYSTQAISQPDKRQPKTGIAMPNDDNVRRARDWVDTTDLS